MADVVFLDHAPRGAGTPTVALKSTVAAVTATVGYAGLAPSNFGSVLGYDAVSADASSNIACARRGFPTDGYSLNHARFRFALTRVVVGLVGLAPVLRIAR